MKNRNYLFKIFKIIILLILTIALIVSILMTAKGAINYIESPRNPPTPKSSEQPNVTINDYIRQLENEKESNKAKARVVFEIKARLQSKMSWHICK